MIEFIMMVGLSGSGKTTWAHEYDSTHLVIDSDEMRKRLLGDEADQTQNAYIFNEMLRITTNALRAEQSVIYSATNLIAKRRISLLKVLRAQFPNVHYKCVIMNTPIEVCHERNSARSRVVPMYVIGRQARQFQCPIESEGWDEITISNSPSFKEKEALGVHFISLAQEFGSQDNPHHTLTLYEHMVETMNKVKCDDLEEKESINLLMASYLHDIGKIYTRTYDENGVAHYYGHEWLGSYLALTMGCALPIVQLIGYHMIPYNTQAIPAWKKRLTPHFWELIERLHEADKRAH